MPDSDNYTPNTNSTASKTQQPSYAEYILACRERLASGHRHLPGITQDRMVAINAPFEWHPDPKHKTQHGYERAAILLHGLNESSFSLRDIGHHLVEQGFLVRGLLLPGHGSQAEDLTKEEYRTWLDTVISTIRDTHKYAQKIYLYGFSLGSTLALHATLLDETVDGLILFAPAIASKSPFAYFARWHKYAAQKIKTHQWRKRRPEVDYAKYCSSSYACINETVKGMRSVRKLLAKKSLKTPVFAVATIDDETVNTPAFLKYAKKYINKKQIILYSADAPKKEWLDDPDIMLRNSFYPGENIINFSHTALHHAPENPHYGRKPDYYDYLHYANAPSINTTPLHLGAITAKNLRLRLLARLHYNPDFENLLLQLDTFIEKET